MTASHPLADAFADQCRRWAGAAPAASRQAVATAARAVVNAALAGHTCLIAAERPDDCSDALLLTSGVVGQTPADGLPLVLDPESGRLALARHAAAEARLAQALSARAATGRLRLFCGGPGTGKTTRVAALLGERLATHPEWRVALAAPTGKAAARLIESLSAQAEQLPATVRARLPQQAATLHRLLGIAPGRAQPTYGREAPLPFDLIVVDEASMLDLALADRLLAALPAHAELILLGDPDQLAAVESGAVFAEICAPGLAPLADCITRLTVSHRFAGDSPLGRLAAAIRDQQPETALACFDIGGDDLCLHPETHSTLTPASLQALAAGYAAFRSALAATGDLHHRAAAAFAAFNRFRILSPLRAGGRGVATINALLDHAALAGQPLREGDWYAGRPLLVLANDPASRLFNGDIGLVLADGDRLQAVFPEGTGFRALPLARLPEHESAWALTVHKSQGSEWEEVALVLPAEDGPLLTRELAYTAVTRARRGVALFGSGELLAAAIRRPTVRHSGLAERIVRATVQE